MKKVRFLLSAVCLIALSSSMKADTLRFLNDSGNGIGPYNLQLNGVVIQLWCLDDLRDVHSSETWTVDARMVLSSTRPTNLQPTSSTWKRPTSSACWAS